MMDERHQAEADQLRGRGEIEEVFKHRGDSLVALRTAMQDRADVAAALNTAVSHSARPAEVHT
jgi:hypothetical protein